MRQRQDRDLEAEDRLPGQERRLWRRSRRKPVRYRYRREPAGRGVRDGQHFAAELADFAVAVSHLDEVRQALDSGQVAEENDEQRPAGDVAEPNG